MYAKIPVNNEIYPVLVKRVSELLDVEVKTQKAFNSGMSREYTVKGNEFKVQG